MALQVGAFFACAYVASVSRGGWRHGQGLFKYCSRRVEIACVQPDTQKSRCVGARDYLLPLCDLKLVVASSSDHSEVKVGECVISWRRLGCSPAATVLARGACIRPLWRIISGKGTWTCRGWRRCCAHWHVGLVWVSAGNDRAGIESCGSMRSHVRCSSASRRAGRGFSAALRELRSS